MPESTITELRRLARFGSEDEHALVNLRPIVVPRAERVASDVYARLVEAPAFAAVIESAADLDRLQGALADWIERLVTGPWPSPAGSKPHEEPESIGAIHVDAGVALHHFVAALHLVRERLLALVAEAHAEDAPLRERASLAIGRAVDLEFAIGFDEYQDAAVARVEGHERELSIRTRRAERLASLGTMAAGLAHEIRNPLNAAHLQLTVMQRRLSRPTGADVPGALSASELVSNEMQRLASLVESFLQFARPQPLNLAETDLRATAHSVLQLMTLSAISAKVSVELAPGPPVLARADNDRIQQALDNLLRNAIEAAGEGGQVTLRVESVGEQARIDVEDDGPGLSSLDAPIFEPFYTTKSDGTGLGLAIVHRIVSDHGGRVAVESRPGRTVFSVYVPTLLHAGAPSRAKAR